MIKNAVIAGHDGNIWASSSGFNVSASFLPQMPLVSKSAKYEEASNRLRGRLLIFDELTSLLGSCYRLCYGRNVKPNKGTEFSGSCTGVGEAGSQLPNLRLSWFFLPRIYYSLSIVLFPALKSNLIQISKTAKLWVANKVRPLCADHFFPSASIFVLVHFIMYH